MSLIIENPQKILALVFGFIDADTIVKKMTEDKDRKLFVNDNKCSCKLCGRVEKEGFIDKKNALIGAKTNSIYSFANPQSPFFCIYCYFNYKNYAEKLYIKNGHKMLNDAKPHHMADIILFEDRYEDLNPKLTSDKDSNLPAVNDLYRLFTNPPAAPFVLMLKEAKGSSIIDMGHTIRPTIDKDMIVVNYGHNNLVCPRKLTLECIEDADNIYLKYRRKVTKKQKAVNISDDVLFNRANSSLYNNYFTITLRTNESFMTEYRAFMNKYNKDVRFTAKIMLESYRNNKKFKNKG